MTNIQLLLAVGLPTLSVLVGILLNNRLLSEFKADIHKRFDSVDKRFDRVETRLDRMDARFDRVDSDMREFFKTTTRLESRVDVLERKS